MDAVTRICIARQYAPETWIRLLGESAGKNGLSSSDSAFYSAAVDTLLPLILPVAPQASSGNADLLKSYLRQCLQSSEIVKRDALFRLLDHARSGASTEFTARSCDAVSLVMLESFPQSLSSLPAEQASVALKLLASAATFTVPALYVLALTLLCRPVTLDKSLLEPLEAARVALYTVPLGSVITSDQVQLASKCLNDIERRLDPSLSRKRKRPSGASKEPELLLQYLLDNNTKEAELHLRASLRARLAYDKAFGLDTNSSDWLKDVLMVCSKRTLGDRRDAARWRSFAYGLLPGILRKMEVDVKDEVEGQFPTLYKWLRSPSSDVPHESDMTPDALMSVLTDVADDFSRHAAASALVRQVIQSHASSSDLPSLATLLRSLTLAPNILDFILLHISPTAFLSPFEHVLSTWDMSEDYGAGQSMEVFGSLQLSLWVVLSRYSIPFTIPSSIYALEALSHEQQVLVSSWITALYGNEGIDDELLRSTHPRTMLALAPTIVHQSLQAHDLGIIDAETLQGGLSYFTQDLLNFTVPGLVGYMMEKNVGMELVKSLLPESTPSSVLELVDLKEGGKHAATSTSKTAPTLEGLRLALDCQSRLQVVSQILQNPDMLMASLLLTLPIVGRPLLDTTLEEYLPILFKTGVPAETLDDLADIIALALNRSGRNRKRMGRSELEAAFWERVDSFSA